MEEYDKNKTLSFDSLREELGHLWDDNGTMLSLQYAGTRSTMEGISKQKESIF